MQPPKLTTHLVQLEKAALDVTLGQIGIDAFRALLERLETLFRRKLDEVRAIVATEIPADFLPEVADEIRVGEQGVEQYLAALQELTRYIETRDRAHIHAGIAMAREANELVNQALTRNWQTYDTYRETAEEFIRQVKGDATPT